jgi:plastocyanin
MVSRHFLTAAIAVLAVGTLAVGCSGDDSPTGPSDGGGGGGGGTGGGTTITINASGVVTPNDITVPPGTRVTFVNNHNRQHDIFSDPHPTHGSCPEVDQVGFIAVGQSKQTGNLNTVGVCGYHDHNDPSNPNLLGRIRVQ